MTIRDWAVEKLRDASQPAMALGSHGIRVPRTGRPDALGYCAEPDTMDPFTADHLVDALTEAPSSKMIIVFPSRQVITPDVYATAEQ